MIALKIITITFFYFFGNNLFSQSMTFDNFSLENHGKWEFITDQVMGGKSTGNYNFLNENQINFIRLTGMVSLDNNGGFIQVRRKVAHKIKSSFKEILLTARGNNEDYFLHIRTNFTLLPWQYYQTKFTVKKNWRDIRVPLKDFKRSGIFLPNNIKSKDIKSIALVAFGRKHKVLLDVSEIYLVN